MTEAADTFSTVIPLQIPEQVRAFAEKGVSQAREGYARLEDAAHASTGAINAVLASASKGATDYSSKMLQIARTNTDANFEFAQELLGAKSVSQAVELWTGFARKQVEAYTAQSKELFELTKKVAAETAEPIKAGASKIVSSAA